MTTGVVTPGLRVVPCTLRQAQEFVQFEHRHHDAAQGGLWALALMRGDELVGVAIAGRPVSAVLQRRGYCEIVRVCVLSDVPNGCSMLYGRCRRVAQAMGYAKCVTYTLPEESGSSPSAAGFQQTSKTRGGSWDRRKRPRIDKHPTDHARAKAGLKDSTKFGRGARWRTKQNASFSEAVAKTVETRNARSVWTIPSEPFGMAHFATFPRNLPKRCILAGSRPGDIILDPFMGSGTVAQVATDLGRQFIGCELNPEYVAMHEMRRTTTGMAL